MAKVLAKMFAQAREQGGLALQIKLAAQARMTSSDAQVLPDTPENVERVQAACQALGVRLEG